MLPDGLRAGVVHFFGLDPDTWPAVIESARSLGVTALDLPVPWAVHEVAEHRYDFGEAEASKDLGRFLSLVRQAGLRVLVRPGPFVDPELERSGLPARIADDQRYTACDREGRPTLSLAPPRMFAVPSLASTAFREEAAHWLAAVGEVIEPHCGPDGPIVAIELDAVAPLLVPDARWNTDHHPDALDGYRHLLARRHGTLARLREAHGDPNATWEDACPAPALDPGADARRRQRADALDARDEAARDALAGWARAVRRGAAEHLALITRAPGKAASGMGSRIEIGAPPWRAPRTDAENAQALIEACARGERRLRLHALADTGRWIGAPIDARGRVRPAAEPLRRVLQALDAVAWSRLTRADDASGLSVEPAAVDASVDCEGERPVLLWLRNRGDTACETRVRLPRPAVASDVLTDETFEAPGGRGVPLGPHQARMLRLASSPC